MNRRKCMILIKRLAVGLAMTGFGVIGLSYVVALPTWLALAFGAAAGVTVGVGVLLCYPYLEKGSYPGFVLGGKAGDPPRWLVGLMVVSVFAAALMIITSGGNHGTPVRGPAGEYLLDYKGTTTAVDRVEWLKAGAREIRVVIGIANFFVCLIAVWCASAANAGRAPRS